MITIEKELIFKQIGYKYVLPIRIATHQAHSFTGMKSWMHKMEINQQALYKERQKILRLVNRVLGVYFRVGVQNADLFLFLERFGNIQKIHSLPPLRLLFSVTFTKFELTKSNMAAKDKYHDIVCEALLKDGWTITDDPLKFEVDGRNIKIDLGAERLIGAEKDEEKIAIEVKSFIGASQLYDLYNALGQFSYYYLALEKDQPERTLYLAVPTNIYKGIFQEPLTAEVLVKFDVNILVYDILKKYYHMEKIAAYKAIIKEVLDQVVGDGDKPDDEVRTQIIKDDVGGHYLLFQMAGNWISVITAVIYILMQQRMVKFGYNTTGRI